MIKIIIPLLLLVSISVFGQLIPTIPPLVGPYINKSQLWNISLTNTAQVNLNVQIQIRLNDIMTGDPLLTAFSREIIIHPGVNRLAYLDVMPIQYNNVNPDFVLDSNPDSPLPIGGFHTCYTFSIIDRDKVTIGAEECTVIKIPPSSPPILSLPLNNTAIDSDHPSLSWLPPTPVQAYHDLRYDITIAELREGQSEADAINETNYQSLRNVLTQSLFYNSTNKPLEYGKMYVWQVTAKQGESEIAKSGIWRFKIKDKHRSKDQIPEPFVELRKTGSENFSVFFSTIKIEYINETIDSVSNLLIQDLSQPKSNPFLLPLANKKLVRGINEIEYNGSKDSRFINDHIYLLRFLNSRNEIWQLRFQFKSENANLNN